MAKKQRRQAPRLEVRGLGTTDAQRTGPKQISEKLKGQIDGIRARFRSYVQSFEGMLKKRADLADPLAKLYGACLAEVGRLAYVDFLRMLDPSIPTQRDTSIADGRTTQGYRDHPAYQAGEYLRRLRRADQGERRARPARNSALDNLARSLATLLTAVADPNSFWMAVQGEMRLQPRQLTRLKRLTESTQPLLRLPQNVLHKVPVRVVHMEREEDQLAETA